jgi:hypothetical protein
MPSNRDIRIDNSRNWQRKHLASIEQSYSKAPYFAEYYDLIRKWYDRKWDFLIDLNLSALTDLATGLNVKPEILLSSELGVTGDRISRLVGICRAVNANRFFEGAAGKNYIDETAFADAGIVVEYQDYQHPVYRQLHGDFVSHLSIVDLLFNCGPGSAEILRQ